jgi:hypothetical protein
MRRLAGGDKPIAGRRPDAALVLASILLGAAPALASTVFVQDQTKNTGTYDFVRWGAVDVPSSSDLGAMHLDDFVSSRLSFLGGLLPSSP